jgi:hypothetical protein
MRDTTLPQLELIVIASLVFPTLFPRFAYEWLFFLTFVILLAASHKVYVTKRATGHHKFGTTNTYRDLATGVETPLNEDNWSANGTEECFGPVGFGVINFRNSFNVPGFCRYISLRIEIPNFFSSGIDLGLVEGYKDYYDDGQMTSGLPVGDSFLFFMAPTIRWSTAIKRDEFISIRQFGSATVTTEGRIEI